MQALAVCPKGKGPGPDDIPAEVRKDSLLEFKLQLFPLLRARAAAAPQVAGLPRRKIAFL